MRKIFIDCGGYDGCSIIKFLEEQPEFECVTFEPNEALHGYYRLLPTELVKKAAFNYDGEIGFSIDDEDGDGSSVIKSKRVYFNSGASNKTAPRKQVSCICLSDFIRRNYSFQDYIVLKLDIEGAEYQVLEQMVADDTLKYVDRLLAEFHWEKIQLPEEDHFRLLEQLNGVLDPDEWDALDMAIHGRGFRKKIKRLAKVFRIYVKRVLS